MVGEVRDGETAQISIEAALTGHFVLSTLHTNDAPAAITRLNEMGVEPFITAAAVSAVLAQRLARKLCTHCAEPYEPTHRGELLVLRAGRSPGQRLEGGLPPPQRLYPLRQTGYHGRVGIFQFLSMSDPLSGWRRRTPRATRSSASPRRRACGRCGTTASQDRGGPHHRRKVRPRLRRSDARRTTLKTPGQMPQMDPPKYPPNGVG